VTDGAVAWLALGVSGSTLLWTMFWSVLERRHADQRHADLTQPKLVVKCSLATPVYGGRVRDACLDLTVTNAGMVAITIAGSYLQVRGESTQLALIDWVTQTPQQLPITLDPGSHWTGLVAARTIARSLTKQYGARDTWQLRAYVKDPVRNEYSSSFEFSGDWAQ
jgi:hypothetical protein